MIAVGYVSSVIIIYNIPETRILSTLTCEPGATNESVNSLASHPSNGTVIAGYSDKEIRIFDVNSGGYLTFSILKLTINIYPYISKIYDYTCNPYLTSYLTTKSCI